MNGERIPLDRRLGCLPRDDAARGVTLPLAAYFRGAAVLAGDPYLLWMGKALSRICGVDTPVPAGLLLKKAIGLTQTEKDAREGYEFLYCLLIEPSVRIAERKAAKEASEKKGENEE